jgi:hypothetical protein
MQQMQLKIEFKIHHFNIFTTMFSKFESSKITSARNMVSSIFGGAYNLIVELFSNRQKSVSNQIVKRNSKQHVKPVLVSYRVLSAFSVPKGYKDSKEYMYDFENNFFRTARKYNMNFSTITIETCGNEISVLVTKDPNYILTLTTEDTKIGLSSPEQKMNFKYFYKAVEVKKIEKFLHSVGVIKKFEPKILYQQLSVEM